MREPEGFRGTPGEWVATANDIDEMLGEWTIRDEEGVIICHIVNPYAGYDLAIAYASDPACPMKANATLIRSSKDLLAALQGLIRRIDKREDSFLQGSDEFEAAVAAIAKALQHEVEKP